VVANSDSHLAEVPLHGERAVVRPATPDDVDMLVRWHADPEVAPYWDGKLYSHEQMLTRLARPHVHAYIVELDGEPVGYLQAWFGETDDDDGLDMFLIAAARAGSAPMPRVPLLGTCSAREDGGASQSTRTSGMSAQFAAGRRRASVRSRNASPITSICTAGC
jgi:hypothetical protein